MITDLHMFDFDGTLVDSSHRFLGVKDENGVMKIDLEHWNKSTPLLINDKPLPLCSTFKDLKRSSKDFVMIATARVWCDLSKSFARAHGLDCFTVGRKSINDNRKGIDLKVNGILRVLSFTQFQSVNRIHVYEDNLEYLEGIVESFPEFDCIPHFYESNQGF